MDSDEESEIPLWKGVPATIILINAFDPVNINTAHAATCRVLRQYLRAPAGRYIGVCLYGVETGSSSILDTKDTIDIIPLTTPSLDNFKKFKNFNIKSVTQSKELFLSEVLTHCHSLFSSCKKKFMSRDIVVLSKLDVPPAATDKEITLNRVGKLVEIDISVKLINIAENDYTVDDFYRKFLIQATRQKDVVIEKPIWDPKEIESQVVKLINRHSTVVKLDFQIGNDVSIGVGVYYILKSYESTRLKKEKVDRDTNAIVKSFNQMTKTTINQEEDSNMDVDGAETEVPVINSELLHSKHFGGKQVSFTKDEMKRIKNAFGPPMLKLLGFKPETNISKEKWFLKTGLFLYPNDEKIEGSTVIFKAMYEACKGEGVVAICVLCTRVDSKPKIVALSPCSHPLGLEVEIGFDVIPLPFVENVKDVPAEDNEIVSNQEHKDFLKKIINNLTFDYKPDIFQNPELQAQYRALEIKKIEDDIEPLVDTTKPNSERFEKLEGDKFYEYFGPFGPVAAKRTTSATTGPVNSKKCKMEGYNEEFVQDLIKNRKVMDLTLVQLKEVIKRHNVNKALTGLKKPELAEIVYRYCSKE